MNAASKFDAVFLDRDGVINEEDGIIRSVEQLRLVPGSGEAIARLNRAGLPVIVITNQPVVARGWCTEEELGALHDHLRGLLQGHGASVDAIYYCPHHENANDPAYRMICECRKPRPGLILQAARERSLDLTSCVMIGDRSVDIEAAHAAGTKGWLVKTGFGGDDGKCAATPERIFEDLAAAVDFLLSSPGAPSGSPR